MTLKEIRFIRGISQKELSVLTGIHQTTLSHIERYLQKPNEVQKQKIINVLQLNNNAISWEVNR